MFSKNPYPFIPPPPHPHHNPVLSRLGRADPSPQDAGILVAEPPRRAGQSWRGGNTPLWPEFLGETGHSVGRHIEKLIRLPPGQWLGSFAADGLALALARRWHVAHAAASGGVLVFMASREEVVPDLRGW